MAAHEGLLQDAGRRARPPSADEIKKAYRKLAKKFHPDVTGGDKARRPSVQGDHRGLRVLGDDKKRAEYDERAQAVRRCGPTACPAGFDADGVRPDLRRRSRARRGGGGAVRAATFDIGDIFEPVRRRRRRGGGRRAARGRARPRARQDVVARARDRASPTRRSAPRSSVPHRRRATVEGQHPRRRQRRQDHPPRRPGRARAAAAAPRATCSRAAREAAPALSPRANGRRHRGRRAVPSTRRCSAARSRCRRSRARVTLTIPPAPRAARSCACAARARSSADGTRGDLLPRRGRRCPESSPTTQSRKLLEEFARLHQEVGAPLLMQAAALVCVAYLVGGSSSDLRGILSEPTAAMRDIPKTLPVLPLRNLVLFPGRGAARRRGPRRLAQAGRGRGRQPARA